MRLRRKLLFVPALLLLLALPLAAFAAPRSATLLTGDVCPHGDGWSEHQDPPLHDVGASNYCVKGGSENSEGCTGYLEEGSFSHVQDVVNADGACGLSHWSYELPEPTDTPVPTDVPTPTEGPSPTPTATLEPGVTPTATPERPEKEPKTGPEAIAPIGAGIAFLALSGVTIAAFRRFRRSRR